MPTISTRFDATAFKGRKYGGATDKARWVEICSDGFRQYFAFENDPSVDDIRILQSVNM